MKVRFSEIEEARANPAAFKAKKASKEKQGGGWYPHRLVEYAIHHMHKGNQGRAQARARLTQELDKHFPGHPSASEALADFDRYVDSYEAQDGRYTTGWKLVDVPLPAEFAQDFAVGGRVMRIDIAPEGYGAWIFSKKCGDWSADRRLPMMQAAVAAELGVDVEEVTAGVYCFEDGQHHAVPYDFDEIEREIAEVCKVLSLLR